MILELYEYMYVYRIDSIYYSHCLFLCLCVCMHVRLKVGRPDRGAFKVPGDDKVQTVLSTVHVCVYIHVSDAISMGTSSSNHNDLCMILSSTLLTYEREQSKQNTVIGRAKGAHPSGAYGMNLTYIYVYMIYSDQGTHKAIQHKTQDSHFQRKISCLVRCSTN